MNPEGEYASASNAPSPQPSGSCGEAGEGFFEVVGDVAGHAPLVPVGAEDAAAVGVVEQDELARELVLIRRDLLAEDAQRRAAVPSFMSPRTWS